MSKDDLNYICLNIKEFDDFWTSSVLENEFSNPNSSYLVIKETNKVIGFGGIWFGFEEVHITNIAINKAYRNKGLGYSLLSKLIEIAKNTDNIYSITLEVNEKNNPAICLYKKLGFKKTGIRKNYYNGHENAIIMTKEI